MTLTVNPAVGQSADDRARQLSDAWKVVVKRARRKWTKAPLEYLAVFEETKKGEPHLHILARAPYIPQKWLSDQMLELIAAPVVDIRRVGRVGNAAAYVAKYVGKGPKPFISLKRYWQSQGWDLTEPDAWDQLDGEKRHWEVFKEPLVVVRDWLSQWGPQAVWIDEQTIFLERAPPRGWEMRRA